MDILRFITAGSVDDGKSTLIGRLLYDSKSILVDQLEALEAQSKNKNAQGIDLAILTDGLRAEREQGITIDVAYRYFATPVRKFIIADAPGHVQYTRNMITGASNSEVMVVLIDARQGVIEQTKRHSIIASLLNMKHIVVAVNKMDLVNYEQSVFDSIVQQYKTVASQLGLSQVSYFPISAFHGDNIVETSDSMDWYKGPTLLGFLESIELSSADSTQPRFQVQYVLRPQTKEYHDYRGYAGQILSGHFEKGDRVQVLPSGMTSEITAIEIHGESVEKVHSGQPAVLHLADDIDISRGDFFVKEDQLPRTDKQANALVCWLGNKPLTKGAKYLLQQKSRMIKVAVHEVDYLLDVNTLERKPQPQSVHLNEIVHLRLKAAQEFVYDNFSDNPTTGSAILIDETSNSTVGAVMFI